MTVIYSYGFAVKYSGSPEFDGRNPDFGGIHRCMLFLRQDGDVKIFLDYKAIFEIMDLDFYIREGRKLNIAALNAEAYCGFTTFDEEALESRRALVLPRCLTFSSSGY